MREEVTVELCQELGIEKTEDLGVYLGAPLLHQRKSRQSYAFMLD